MSEWTMQNWMERYRDTIDTPEGLTVEDCMSGKHGFYNTSVVAVQVLLLHRLRVTGVIPSEMDSPDKMG